MEIVSHGMISLGLTFTMAGSCWEFLFGLVCFFFNAMPGTMSKQIFSHGGMERENR